MATVRISANDTTVVQIEDGEREALVSVLAVPGQDPIICLHGGTTAVVQPADNAARLHVSDVGRPGPVWRTPGLTARPASAEEDIER